MKIKNFKEFLLPIVLIKVSISHLPQSLHAEGDSIEYLGLLSNLTERCCNQKNFAKKLLIVGKKRYFSHPSRK